VDGVECPARLKQQRSTRDHEALTTQKPAAAAPVKPAGSVDSRETLNGQEEAMLETTPGKTNSAAEAVATKRCQRPGCTTVLGPKNKSGRCGRHFHWGESGKNAGNGHVAASCAGANGARTRQLIMAANRSNGSTGRQESTEATADLTGEFREDRLDRLIMSLNTADKAKLVLAWLRGQA
jgi:hypothetical protein